MRTTDPCTGSIRGGCYYLTATTAGPCTRYPKCGAEFNAWIRAIELGLGSERAYDAADTVRNDPDPRGHGDAAPAG